MRRRVAVSVGAACAGLVALLVVSAIAGVALGAALPAEPPAGVRVRLPFWLAAAALGGGLQVVGPGAGRVSMLNDGGLIGRPQGVSAIGSERFRLDVVPLPLTLLCIVAVAVVLRRAYPVDRVTGRLVAGSAAMVGAVFALAGVVLAFSADYAAVDAGVHPGRVVTPVGAAAVGMAAVLLGLGPRLSVVRRGPLAPALRAAAVVGTAIAAIGTAAAAVVGAVGRLGIIDTLLSNDRASGAAKALLGALIGPAAGFNGVLVGSGAPLHVEGRAFGFSQASTWWLPRAVDRAPITIFLPLVAVAIVIVAGVIVHLTRVTGRPLAAALASYAAVFVAGAALAHLAAHIDFRRVYGGAVRESATVTTGWPMTLIIAAVAGVVVALVGWATTAAPGRAASIDQAPPLAGRTDSRTR